MNNFYWKNTVLHDITEDPEGMQEATKQAINFAIQERNRHRENMTRGRQLILDELERYSEDDNKVQYGSGTPADET